MTWGATSFCAMWRPAPPGRRAFSRAASSLIPIWSPLPRIARNSSAPMRRITTTLEVVVSPEDDAEVRRLSIANTGYRDREIEVTSYVELVLAPPAADASHQAFSKLFVQTEYVAKSAHPPRHAPQARARGAGDLGGSSCGRRGQRCRESRRSKRTGRAFSAAAGKLRSPLAVHGWAAAVRYRGGGAGSRLCASISGKGGRRHDGADCLLDGRRLLARRRARPARQASRGQLVHACGHARLDPGPGAIAPPGHRFRRGGPFPAPIGPSALCRSLHAAALRHDTSRRRPAGGIVGAEDLGRYADPAAAHRRHRRHGHRASIGASP